MILNRRAADSLILLLIVLCAWQALYGIVGAIALTPPLTTVANALGMLADIEFWPNVASSFRALGLAIGFEVVLGLSIGALLGLNRLAGEVMEPVIMGFYAVPKIVFYPVVLMVCGIGVTSVVVFAVMHGILPIILFTMNAVRAIKPIFLRTGRALRLTVAQTVWSIALPAAIPEVFTGLRIGFAATMLGVLLSEMFGSKNGLGFLLMNAIGLNHVNDIMALTLLLAGFAAVVNLLLLAVDRRLHGVR
ncbi:MAG: ABC transporter permease subunit [Rhodospirillales bacterium]